MDTKPQQPKETDLADALPENQDTTVPQNTQPQKEKKRRSRPLLVLLLLLLIAVLGGAAALLSYQYFKPQPKAVETTTQVSVPKKHTAASVIADIKPTYKSEMQTNAAGIDVVGVSAPIKVAGYDYYTRIDTDKSVTLTGSVPYTDSAVVVANIAKILKQQDFTEKMAEASHADVSYFARYTETNVICEVSIMTTANNPTGDHFITATCANMSDYKAAAAAQKPLYAVYPTKESPDGSSLLLGPPMISNSKTAGYKTATMSMNGIAKDGSETLGGFAGLFYQTPDTKWHFFRGVQNMLQCSDYNTDDLKKAYLGTACGTANGVGEAKVTL